MKREECVTRAESALVAVVAEEEAIDPVEPPPRFIDDAQERHPAGLSQRRWIAVALT
jgi:hypothetical protein